MLNFGERLKRARERKGLTQRDVMKLTGITNKSLSRYENNTTSPDPDTIQVLILLYDVSADYIFGLTDEMGHASQRGDSKTPPALLSESSITALEEMTPESRAKAEEYIAMLQALEQVNGSGSGAKSSPSKKNA